jgi:hypothetical protein
MWSYVAGIRGQLFLRCFAGFRRSFARPQRGSLLCDGPSNTGFSPFGLSVLVRNGNVHLSGVITNEKCRQAAIVAAENVSGVKNVHDHLCWVEPMSGMYRNSQEDEALLRVN